MSRGKRGKRKSKSKGVPTQPQQEGHGLQLQVEKFNAQSVSQIEQLANMDREIDNVKLPGKVAAITFNSPAGSNAADIHGRVAAPRQHEDKATSPIRQHETLGPFGQVELVDEDIAGCNGIAGQEADATVVWTLADAGAAGAVVMKILSWALVLFALLIDDLGNVEKSQKTAEASINVANVYPPPVPGMTSMGAMRIASYHSSTCTEELQRGNVTLYVHFLSSALGTAGVTFNSGRSRPDYGEWYDSAIACANTPIFLLPRCPRPYSGALVWEEPVAKRNRAVAYAEGVGRCSYGEDPALSPTGAYLAGPGYYTVYLTAEGQPPEPRKPAARLSVDGAAAVAICGYLGTTYSLEGIDQTGDLTGIVPAAAVMQCLAEHPEAWVQGCNAEELLAPYPPSCYPLEIH